MYKKRVFNKIGRDNSFSPQKEIFSTFYSRGSSSTRSEFPGGFRPASSDSSYLKFKPITNKSEFDQQDSNEIPRQTLHTTKNYDRVSKFSRYEYVGTSSANNNGEETKNQMAQMRSPVRNEEEIMDKGQTRDGQGTNRMSNPGVNLQFQPGSGSKLQQFQAMSQNRNTVQSEAIQRQEGILLSNQAPRAAQQQQSNKHKLERPPPDKHYTQIDLVKEMETHRQKQQISQQNSSILSGDQQKQLNLQKQISNPLNSSMNQKKAMDSGAALQKKDVKEDVKDINLFEYGAIKDYQNDKVRLSVLSQSRVQHMESDVNKSQSIQFQNLVLDLEGVENNDALRYSTVGGQKQLLFNTPSIVDNTQQQVINEIIKLKALLEKVPQFRVQHEQVKSIIKRYELTQKHQLVVYFQELYNVTHGVDKAIDQQLLTLLSLISKDIQKDKDSPAVNPVTERQTRNDQQQQQQQQPVKAIPKQAVRNQSETAPNTSRVPGSSTSQQPALYNKNDVIEDCDSDVQESPKKNRHTNIFQGGSRNKDANKRYNSTEAQLPRGQTQNTYNSARENTLTNNQANQPRGSYIEEVKAQRMSVFSQAESQIEQKLMDAQKSVDRELEARKRQLEKEQVLYFYDLCMKLRGDEMFAGCQPQVKSISIQQLYEKCKQKKYLKEQFKDFIITEFKRQLRIMSGEVASVASASDAGSDDSGSNRDSNVLAHRDKNIFVNKKRSNAHRGTHNMSSMNKIEVINEKVDQEGGSDEEESKTYPKTAKGSNSALTNQKYQTANPPSRVKSGEYPTQQSKPDAPFMPKLQFGANKQTPGGPTQGGPQTKGLQLNANVQQERQLYSSQNNSATNKQSNQKTSTKFK